MLQANAVFNWHMPLGVAKPLSVYVNTHGTSLVDDRKIEQAINNLIDLSPKGIRTHLKLNRPIYKPTASYGHFGRDAKNGFFTWEALDLVDKIKKAL